jgi:hypothetical protein
MNDFGARIIASAAYSWENTDDRERLRLTINGVCLFINAVTSAVCEPGNSSGTENAT